MQVTKLTTAALLATLGVPGAVIAQPAIGDPAPHFKVQDTLGDVPASLAALRGKAVLLDLFATW